MTYVPDNTWRVASNITRLKDVAKFWKATLESYPDGYNEFSVDREKLSLMDIEASTEEEIIDVLGNLVNIENVPYSCDMCHENKIFIVEIDYGDEDVVWICQSCLSAMSAAIADVAGN